MAALEWARKFDWAWRRPASAAQRRPACRSRGFASHVEALHFADACHRESWKLAGQSAMIKDLADDDTIVDEGDPPAPSAAVGAFEQSNSKDAFQQLGPRRALRARLIRASGDAGRRTRDRREKTRVAPWRWSGERHGGTDVRGDRAAPRARRPWHAVKIPRRRSTASP